MVCPRCGATLNSTQRYCMKCGALNYEHPDNQKMKQYITEQEIEDANQEYQKTVNSQNQTIEIAGKVYSDTPVVDKKTTYVDTRIMVGLLFIVTICLGAIYYFVFPYSILMTLILCLVFFLLVFAILTTISIYMKGGYSGFSPFIPFYGQYAYFDIALGNGWLFLISFIPIVGLFYSFYVSFKIGKAFGKSGWLTLFFPFIMLPIIAFSDRAVYSGPSDKYKAYVEKGKKRNTKVPAFICSVVVFLLFLGFTQTSISLIVASYFTEMDVDRVTKTVERDVRDGLYVCDGEVLGSQKGSYYIPVKNLSDVQNYPIPIRSSSNGKKLYGYFRVQVSNKKTSVLANFTDGVGIFSDDDIYSFSVPEGAVLCQKSV